MFFLPRRRLSALALFAFFTSAVPMGVAAQTADDPAATLAGSDAVDSVLRPVESLDDLLAGALSAHPALLAARARVHAAMRRPSQARSLPDPVLSFTARNVDFPEITIGDEMMSLVGVRFTQPIPAAGKRPAREQVALHDVEVSSAHVELVRRRIVGSVTDLYYRIGFVDEAIALVDDTYLLVQELERTAQARYAVGEALQQDVFKAQVQITEFIARRARLALERDTLVAELNAMLNRPARTPLGLTEKPPAPPLPSDLPKLQSEAALASAELHVLDRRIERQQAAVELKRLDARPDLTLGGGWMYRGSYPSIWEINVGLTLPIRKSQRQTPATDEQLDELRAQRQDRVTSAVGLEADVRDAWLRMERAQDLAEMYAEVILPQASLSFESTLASYRVARVDFLSVLDAIGKLLTYRTELERERTEYLVAAAALEVHLGRSLGVSPKAAWRPAAGSAPPGPHSLPAAGDIR